MSEAELQILCVPLRGGFGNKLFQIAAALDWASEQDTLRKAVLYSSDVAFLDYISPLIKETKLVFVKQDLQLSQPWQKLIGFRLRYMSVFRKHYLSWASEALDKVLGKLVLFDGRPYDFFIPNDLGFETFPKTTRHILAIGYFQTWVYSGNLTDRIRRVVSTGKRGENSSTISRGRQDKEILVVHFRLGDYLNEKKFGILGWDYYRSCIELAFAKVRYEEIWIFSNDIQLSRKLYEDRISNLIGLISNNNHSVETEWFGEDEFSLFESFELMRQGTGFIIANSSFSWWAACTSVNESENVFCPKPWFKYIPEPTLLVPKNWVRISSHFEEAK